MVKYPVGFLHAGFMPFSVRSFALQARRVGMLLIIKDKSLRTPGVPVAEPEELATGIDAVETARQRRARLGILRAIREGLEGIRLFQQS
jgi:hypothetical protein